ncbi:MAG: D-aminoacyl-tRNA deacylase [Planctomycetota bacterium]
MRTVIQRVSSASVRVEGQTVAHIERGLLVLAAIMKGDRIEHDVLPVADRVASLRIFADERGKLNLAPRDVGGMVLVVSQFTLAGNLSRGRRPEFLSAESSERARELVLTFAQRLRQHGLVVEQGVFGANMQVELVNDGPVTLWLDSQELRGGRA